MKNRALRALLIGLCVVSLAPAAETAESQLKAFQKAATAALAQKPATPGDRRGETSAYTLASLAQLSTNSANPQEIERVITSIVVLTQHDPDVAKAAESLIATMKAERQARIDQARAGIEALLKQAGESCLSAKTPADLDATLSTLAPYSRNSGYDRRASDDQESWQRGSNAYRFVTRWQDYLAALAQPNIGEATNILRELSNSVDTGVMPRSQVVARLSPSTTGKTDAAQATANPLAEVAKQLEKARTLEEFIAVARALRAANPSRNQYEQSPLHQALSNLIEQRQQVLAGIRPSSLFADSGTTRQFSPQDPNSSEAIQAALIGFRRETQFAGIRLALTGTKLPEPKVDDTLDSYIIRAVENLVADKNWLQVRETLELYRTLFINSNRPPTWVAGDIEGCTAYLAARNLDLAEQYPAAIASYRRALRSVGRYTPVEAISARLAELKKSNPEAFTQADSASDTDSNPTYRAGQPGNFPPGYGPSIPRSPGGLRPAAPTGPLTPAPTNKPATTTP